MKIIRSKWANNNNQNIASCWYEPQSLHNYPLSLVWFPVFGSKFNILQFLKQRNYCQLTKTKTIHCFALKYFCAKPRVLFMKVKFWNLRNYIPKNKCSRYTNTQEREAICVSFPWSAWPCWQRHYNFLMHPVTVYPTPLGCLTLLTKALQFLDASSNCLPHTLGLLDPADKGTTISRYIQ